MKTNQDESLFKFEIKDSSLTIGSNLLKREYFAAMALQGLLTDANEYMRYNGVSRIGLAKDAIHFADLLIEELSEDENMKGE